MTLTFGRSEGSWGASLRIAVVPWLVGRLLVLAALATARHVASELSVVPRPIQLGQGLLAWDAAFYADIAGGGYDSLPETGLRFFPLVPLLARAFDVLPGLDARAGMVVVANLSAFVFAVVLHRLAEHEGADPGLARRAVWLAALAPPAFVMVLGYAEATLMALAVLSFWAVRTRHFGLAAATGFAAGIARPVGVLLVLPVLIEALRDRHRPVGRDLATRALAVVAPVIGLFTYLLWVRDRTGDFWLALDLHNVPELRGGTAEPVGNLIEAAGDLFGGDRIGSGLHFVSGLVLIALVAVLAGRWPASYTWYAAASVGLALTASNLDSLERYAFSTFPVLLAAAEVTGRPVVERTVLVVAGAGLFGASVLAFTGILVP